VELQVDTRIPASTLERADFRRTSASRGKPGPAGETPQHPQAWLDQSARGEDRSGLHAAPVRGRGIVGRLAVPAVPAVPGLPAVPRVRRGVGMPASALPGVPAVSALPGVRRGVGMPASGLPGVPAVSAVRHGLRIPALALFGLPALCAAQPPAGVSSHHDLATTPDHHSTVDPVGCRTIARQR
jgi:hypothetical protein